MDQLGGLLLDGLHNGIGRVAQVEHADPAGEVDVLAAVGVGEARAVGASGEDRRNRDAARDVAVTLGAKRL